MGYLTGKRLSYPMRMPQILLEAKLVYWVQNGGGENTYYGLRIANCELRIEERSEKGGKSGKGETRREGTRNIVDVGCEIEERCKVQGKTESFCQMKRFSPGLATNSARAFIPACFVDMSAC